MSTTYVVSGGTPQFAAALSRRLRANRIVTAADADVADLAAWVHLLPADEPLAEIAALADECVPRGVGACFTIVAPVWGAIDGEYEETVELDAAAAHALMQTRLERWAAENRRINVVRYVPPAGGVVANARDPETLVARTPMKRIPGTDEIADAIDFLASSAAAYVTGSVMDVDGGWNAYSWFYPARVI